jgi:predicted dehydrogenase
MQDSSRRAVLAGIGAGLAGAAAPALAQGSGRKIGYAVVGLGSYATRQIMPNFKGCDHAKLVALVSGTPAKLEQYGTEYGIPRTHRYSYADFDRIRDNPDIDAVYVVLPVFLHAEYTIRAARAGKHVMCEKPMAVSSAECRQMIDACRRANRKLMIGYRSRFEPYNRLAIELARGGHVGPTKLIESEHGFPIRPGQWRLDKAKSGGGSMMDIGIYSLQAARYLSGEEPVGITAVETTDKTDPRFRTVEDRVSFLLEFPSGIQANCVSSYSTAHNGYRVHGADGWIGMEPATAYEGHSMRIRKGGTTEPRELPKPRKNQFAGQLDHLAECIMNGREPIVPGEEGLADIRVVEAVYRSMQERRRVTLA